MRSAIRCCSIRLLAVLFGGACAGLAGAYLSLAYTPFFIPGMTAGRGWIALALVVFASWRPWRGWWSAPICSARSRSCSCTRRASGLASRRNSCRRCPISRRRGAGADLARRAAAPGPPRPLPRAGLRARPLSCAGEARADGVACFAADNRAARRGTAGASNAMRTEVS